MQRNLMHTPIMPVDVVLPLALCAPYLLGMFMAVATSPLPLLLASTAHYA